MGRLIKKKLRKKLRKKFKKELVKLLLKQGEKVLIGVVAGGVSRLLEATTGGGDQKAIRKAAKAAVREARGKGGAVPDKSKVAASE